MSEFFADDADVVRTQRHRSAHRQRDDEGHTTVHPAARGLRCEAPLCRGSEGDPAAPDPTAGLLSEVERFCTAHGAPPGQARQDALEAAYRAGLGVWHAPGPVPTALLPPLAALLLVHFGGLRPTPCRAILADPGAPSALPWLGPFLVACEVLFSGRPCRHFTEARLHLEQGRGAESVAALVDSGGVAVLCGGLPGGAVLGQGLLLASSSGQGLAIVCPRGTFPAARVCDERATAGLAAQAAMLSVQGPLMVQLHATATLPPSDVDAVVQWVAAMVPRGTAVAVLIRSSSAGAATTQLLGRRLHGMGWRSHDGIAAQLWSPAAANLDVEVQGLTTVLLKRPGAAPWAPAF